MRVIVPASSGSGTNSLLTFFEVDPRFEIRGDGEFGHHVRGFGLGVQLHIRQANFKLGNLAAPPRQREVRVQIEARQRVREFPGAEVAFSHAEFGMRVADVEVGVGGEIDGGNGDLGFGARLFGIALHIHEKTHVRQTQILHDDRQFDFRRPFVLFLLFFRFFLARREGKIRKAVGPEVEVVGHIIDVQPVDDDLAGQQRQELGVEFQRTEFGEAALVLAFRGRQINALQPEANREQRQRKLFDAEVGAEALLHAGQNLVEHEAGEGG
ncbi:MAG: hypothetical protein M5R36_16630 [Deltaproteobacteria bacterium]|nr:hypothetical protein [Deltaproteobacteria bacterium]